MGRNKFIYLILISCISILSIATSDCLTLDYHGENLRRIRQQRDALKIIDAFQSRKEPIELVVLDFDGTLVDESGRVPEAIIQSLIQILENEKQVVIISLARRKVINNLLLKFLPQSDFLYVYTRAITFLRGKGIILREVLNSLKLTPNKAMIIADQLYPGGWDEDFLSEEFRDALKFNVGEDRTIPDVISLETKNAAASSLILSLYNTFYLR